MRKEKGSPLATYSEHKATTKSCFFIFFEYHKDARTLTVIKLKTYNNSLFESFYHQTYKVLDDALSAVNF